ERCYTMRNSTRPASGIRSVVIWDTHTLREVGRISFAQKGFFASMLCTISPDGRFLTSGSFVPGSPLQLLDLIAARKLPSLQAFRAVFSPDSRRMVVIGWDGRTRVYDTRSWKEAAPPLKHVPKSLNFSPDGRLLVTGSYGGTVSVWDAASWRLT